MTCLSAGDKHYTSKTISDNEEFYIIVEQIIENLLTKKITYLSAGFDYHYITFKGDIKTKKHQLHGQDYIRIFNDTIEFDINPRQWTEIVVRKNNKIEIDTRGGGLYIEMEGIEWLD